MEQRKDGRFHGWVRFAKGPKGRQQVYAQSPEEWLVKKESLLKSKSKSASEERTYPPGSFGEFYPTYAALAGKASNTKKKYASVAKCHLLPTFGNTLLSVLGTKHTGHKLVEGYAAKLPAIVASPKHQKDILCQLRAVLKMARKRGLIDIDPTEFVSLPETPFKKERIPEEDGFALALYKAAEGHWMHGPVYGALTLGMTRGEVCGLRKDCLDVQGLMVRIKWQRLEGGEIAPPKRGRVRDIPVSKYIMDEMVRLSHPDSVFVWAFPDGSPIDPITLTHEFPKLCKRAGVPIRRFHDLRSYYATNLAAVEHNPWIVMQTLGHKSLNTSRIYVDDVREAVDRAARAREMPVSKGVSRQVQSKGRTE